MRKTAFKIGIRPVDFDVIDLADFGDYLSAYLEMHPTKGKGKSLTPDEVRAQHEQIKKELGDPKEWLPPGAKIINW